MDNFKVIYKILKKLEESMDCERFDMGTINHEAMEISKTRWNRIIKMMIDNNLISEFSLYQQMMIYFVN